MLVFSIICSGACSGKVVLGGPMGGPADSEECHQVAKKTRGSRQVISSSRRFPLPELFCRNFLRDGLWLISWPCLGREASNQIPFGNSVVCLQLMQKRLCWKAFQQHGGQGVWLPSGLGVESRRGVYQRRSDLTGASTILRRRTLQGSELRRIIMMHASACTH